MIGAKTRALGRLFASPGAAIGLLVLLIVIGGAIIAPAVAPYDWNGTGVCRRLAAPSAAHLFGCDLFGRDVFSRVLYGGRYSLTMGLSTVAISTIFGGLFGVIIAYAGGKTDSVGTRAIDIMLGFPPILLAILLIAIFGVGLFNAALAVGLTSIPRFARVIRGATLSLATLDYVEAAHALGARQIRIIWRHLLPNLAPTIIVLATLDLGNAVLFTATLSFLGLGAQPPTPEWGTMLNAGRDYVRYAPWTMIYPGLALFLTVMAVNLVGDRLSRVLDPKRRQR
jgi:ABC-type dipeptide/oligopeptide/nickel transport system permease subunit